MGAHSSAGLERFSDKEEVPGSNPGAPTIFFLIGFIPIVLFGNGKHMKVDQAGAQVPAKNQSIKGGSQGCRHSSLAGPCGNAREKLQREALAREEDLVGKLFGRMTDA